MNESWPLLDDPVFSAVDGMARALQERPSADWVIAYSGGKDSTATLKIFLAGVAQVGGAFPNTTLIYCDTGVENPVLDHYVKRLLGELSEEFASQPNFNVRVLKSPLHERFFVKVIGRGYPPPTNSFRWCTKGLRIQPVSHFIQSKNPDNTVVLLGLRKSESQQRDRSISQSEGAKWQKQREGVGTYDLFLPILELTVPEVWDAIYALRTPKIIDARALELLYRDASGECPVIRAPQAPPCASGRFGCWTCTVVRKDRSASQLIDSGYTELRPFLKFRDWLSEIRNDPARRWPTRRNGSPGLGPFTMDTRREILAKVDELEAATRTTIIDNDERGVISALWRLDHVPRLRQPVRADAAGVEPAPRQV